jgi:hypothetical protein
MNQYIRLSLPTPMSAKKMNLGHEEKINEAINGIADGGENIFYFIHSI